MKKRLSLGLYLVTLSVLVVAMAMDANADEVKYKTSPYCKQLLDDNDTVRYERNCKIDEEDIKGCIPATPCEVYNPLKGGH